MKPVDDMKPAKNFFMEHNKSIFMTNIFLKLHNLSFALSIQFKMVKMYKYKQFSFSKSTCNIHNKCEILLLNF